MAKPTTVHYLHATDAAQQLGISVADAQAAISSPDEWHDYGPHKYRLFRTPETDPHSDALLVTGEIQHHINSNAAA